MAKGRNKHNTSINSSKSDVDSKPLLQQILPIKKQSSLSFLLLIMFGISLVVFCFFNNCQYNLFTDWDDKGYLLNNPLITDISLTQLKKIFTTPVMGNYHPLTILTYAIEYHYVQFEPWLYHIDNLILHVVATLSVFVLTYLLLNNTKAAIITSLLFGLHPVHVESVAWVADRKDLLYSLFFILGNIVYVYYLNNIFKR